MTDIQKSETPITGGSKFPKWIIYILIAIAIGIAKGGMKGCIREKAINDATRDYNQGH